MIPLPVTCPISTAAALAGLAPATFKSRCINSGLVQCEDRKVLLRSLARYLGRQITLEEFYEADRKRDPARQAQRRYRRTH